MMDAKRAKALRDPFPPSAIGHVPKGGVQLAYVGHAATTDRLLQVDPAWTWEPLALDDVGLPAMDAAGNLWIRLTVCGVTRIGVGDGKTQKERIGDAIRNSAMRFGVALDLWAKEDLSPSGRPFADELAQEGVAYPPQTDDGAAHPASSDGAADVAPSSPGRLTEAQQKRMHASFTQLGITDRDARLTYTANVIGRVVESSNDLSVSDGIALLNALDADLRDVAASTEGPPL